MRLIYLNIPEELSPYPDLREQVQALIHLIYLQALKEMPKLGAGSVWDFPVLNESSRDKLTPERIREHGSAMFDSYTTDPALLKLLVLSKHGKKTCNVPGQCCCALHHCGAHGPETAVGRARLAPPVFGWGWYPVGEERQAENPQRGEGRGGRDGNWQR